MAGRLSHWPERASSKARSTVVGRSRSGGLAISAPPRRGGRVEPEACIAIGIAEMRIPFGALGRARGEPAGPGLEPLVIACIGRRGRGWSRARVFRSGPGRAGRRGGLDAVAAGEIEVDEPRLGARRPPGIGSRAAFPSEPVFLFHKQVSALQAGALKSPCHAMLAGTLR